MSNSYSSYMSIEPSTQMVVEASKAAETSYTTTVGEEDGPIVDFEAGLCFGPKEYEGIDHQKLISMRDLGMASADIRKRHYRPLLEMEM